MVGLLGVMFIICQYGPASFISIKLLNLNKQNPRHSKTQLINHQGEHENSSPLIFILNNNGIHI